MKKATRVDNIELRGKFTGQARLYLLSPPMTYTSYEWAGDTYDEVEKSTEYVIVSATNTVSSGPETYIFPAGKKGNITSWRELEGLFKGGLNHKEALKRAGYEVQEREAGHGAGTGGGS